MNDTSESAFSAPNADADVVDLDGRTSARITAPGRRSAAIPLAVLTGPPRELAGGAGRRSAGESASRRRGRGRGAARRRCGPARRPTPTATPSPTSRTNAVSATAERHRRVLLDQQHRGALAVDLPDHLADLPDDAAARGPARARRAAAAAGWPSGRVRSPASAARRRRAARLAACRRSAARGTGRRCAGVPWPSTALSFCPSPPARRFSSTVSRVKIRRPSGTWTRPLPTQSGRVLPGEALAVEGDRPAVDPAAMQPQRARDRPQQGRLAGAVAAEHGHHLSGFDVEIDAAQRPDGPAVGHVQLTYRKHVPRSARCWPRVVWASQAHPVSCVTAERQTLRARYLDVVPPHARSAECGGRTHGLAPPALL